MRQWALFVKQKNKFFRCDNVHRNGFTRDLHSCVCLSKAVKSSCLFVAGFQNTIYVIKQRRRCLCSHGDPEVKWQMRWGLGKREDSSMPLHPRRRRSICMCRVCCLLLRSRSTREKSRQRKERLRYTHRNILRV